MPEAVFIDCSPQMAALLTPERRSMVPQLRIHEGDPEPGDLLNVIGNASVILNGHTQLTADTLRDAPNLRRIVFLGSGPASYIDLAAAAARNIEVLRVTGYGDTTIAEHAMALMFAVARNIPTHDHQMRQGLCAPLPGLQLGGATLGVIGAGGVGCEMIRLGIGIGMNVLYTSRRPKQAADGATHVQLHDLLARADVVSLHLAQTPQTIGYIGAAELARMKPGAILINTSRGALVDQSALIGALQSGHLGGAGLDVFDIEPVPNDAPILSCPNLVLTPHIAFNTPQASERLLEAGLTLVLS